MSRPYEALEADQRARLLYDNSRVDDHTTRLTRAHQTALQSEAIGHEIQGQLREDREKLERAYLKVQDVDDNMRTTRTILLGMSRRAITNKVILVFIIFLLLASIGLVIYLKWGRGLINQVV